jgi:GTPase
VSDIYFPRRDRKGEKVLLHDTIGFIRDLPPKLIQAFASTLEDSIHTDILLHVIDASDPLVDDKIVVVDEILDAIGAQQPRLYVFNKTDKVSPLELAQIAHHYRHLSSCWISAQTKEGIPSLLGMLAEQLL